LEPSRRFIIKIGSDVVISMFVTFLTVPRDHEHLKWVVPHGDFSKSCDVLQVYAVFFLVVLSALQRV
jgi:hypothetical protein